jgi:hypothetical protein
VELSKVGAKERIKALKPKKFDFIDGMKDQLGFVAQDVQSVIPEAVQSTVIGKVMDEKYKNARGDMVPDLMPDRYGLAMNYTFLFPHIVSAIQEMSDDADALKAQIAALEEEVAKLKKGA